MRVRFSQPAPNFRPSSSGSGCPAFNREGGGSNPPGRTKPASEQTNFGSITGEWRSGSATHFECVGRWFESTLACQRGIAQSVERESHTLRQPLVRSQLPRPIPFVCFAGFAKWEGDGLWTRHEAVRFRQPVRECRLTARHRLPTPRIRVRFLALPPILTTSRSQAIKAPRTRSGAYNPRVNV
jgi:hypothetical protein